MTDRRRPPKLAVPLSHLQRTPAPASSQFDSFVNVAVQGTLDVDGVATFNDQIISTVTTGTAPFQISSTTVVTNLNADLLDGQHGSYYQDPTNLTGFGAVGGYLRSTGAAWARVNMSQLLTDLLTLDGAGSLLDADKLDGQEGAYYLPAASYTAADVLAKLITVDGAGSLLDADFLDGNSSAFYQDSSNQNAGTLPSARLSGSYTGITGIGTLVSGAVPASLVTAGTFGAGAYTFPGQLTVTGHLLATPDNTYDFGASGASRFRSAYFGTNILAGTAPASPPMAEYFQWENSTGRMTTLGTAWEQFRYGGGGQFNSYRANGTAGAPTLPVANDVLLQMGAGGWDSVAGNFSATRGRLQVVAAANWVSNTAQGTGLKVLLTAVDGVTASETIRWGPGPWTTASTTASVYPDTQLLFDRFGTPGSGNYGASLAFSGIANSLRRYAAIVARQTTADVDQMGLSLFVHPSATNTAAMEEIVRFSRSGDLNTGWFGGHLAETDNSFDIGASGANRFRTGYFGTSVITPLLNGTTRVTSPLLGTTTATDVVLDRNSVTQLTLGSLAATFAGTVATAAPTGGAGAWKLGVANSVSPTAPNRTITIDIGGTTYYLHAKTTND